MQSSTSHSGLHVKTVIYATDLSVCSQNPAFYAAFLARQLAAELLVAHAFTLSQAASEVEIDPALISEQRKDLEFLLSRKAEMLRGQGLHADSALVEGDPKTALVRLAEQHAPSLLVLGTHGGGWIQREILGSVAEHVLRSTCWPVVTVGPLTKSGAGRDLSFKRILYATDFTAAAARAASYAAWFADAFGSQIDVLHVIERESLDRPDRLSELSRSFAAAMHAAVPQRAMDFSAATAFVESGNSHQQILQHIRDREVDLLVLGVRKVSHFGLRERNSGVFRLILDAICPVLTIVS